MQVSLVGTRGRSGSVTRWGTPKHATHMLQACSLGYSQSGGRYQDPADDGHFEVGHLVVISDPPPLPDAASFANVACRARGDASLLGRKIEGYLEKRIQTPMVQGRSTKIITMISRIRTSRSSKENSLFRTPKCWAQGWRVVVCTCTLHPEP